MNFLGRLLGRTRDEGPEYPHQVEHLARLGLVLRPGRDPWALYDRYHRDTAKVLTVPYYLLLFNGVSVPRTETFQSSPVRGGFAVQGRIDGAPSPLGAPPAQPIGRKRAEERIGAVCRHLAAELGAGDLLQGAFLQSWDPSRGDGTVEITSLDADTGGERSIVVEVADGSLRPVVAALVAALTSAQTASLLTADPADVLDVPSPWVWCFTIPEEHVEEFEELRSTCSLAVIEELERVRPEHWPHPLEDPPDELTTPEPGVPRAAEPISSPRRPPPPYVPRPEDRALWDETVATLVDLGFPLRHEAEMREYVLDEDYAAELREDPLTFLLDADGENSGSSLFGHHVVIDLEFVDEDGAYEDLLDHLAEAAGTSHLITDVASHLDIEGDGREGGSWISFRRDGAPRRYEITIDEDWGDPDVVERLAEDVTPAGHVLETDAFEHFFWIRPEHRAAFFEAWRQRGG